MVSISFFFLLFKIHQDLLRMIFVSNTEDDTEDEENVDPNHVFEHVRQLLLNRKVNTAVKHLWKTCMKLEKSPEIENLTAIAKEECLFTFLHKIFIESEDESLENGNANEDANGDANNADKSEQTNKTREEISTRKRIINYVKVRKIM